MKKFISTITALAVVLGVLVVPQVSAKAEEFTPLKVVTIDNVSEYDEKLEWNTMSHDLTENPQFNYYKFTIPEDSIVRFDVRDDMLYADGKVSDYSGMAGTFSIYSGKSLTDEVLEYSDRINYMGIDGSENAMFTMKKGTYYVKENVKLYNYQYPAHQEPQIAITAIPKSKAMTFDYKVKSGKSVTMKFRSNLDNWTQFGFWGKWSANDKVPIFPDINGFDFTDPIDISKPFAFDASDSGNYNDTLVFRANYKYQSRIWGYKNSSVVQPGATFILKIDKYAPTVKGISNGKTYKSAKIAFKDASGVKSATLNGKSVKSGVKVTKAGSYKLVVRDKHGNTKTVKFKIKK